MLIQQKYILMMFIMPINYTCLNVVLNFESDPFEEFYKAFNVVKTKNGLPNFLSKFSTLILEELNLKSILRTDYETTDKTLIIKCELMDNDISTMKKYFNYVLREVEHLKQSNTFCENLLRDDNNKLLNFDEMQAKKKLLISKIKKIYEFIMNFYENYGKILIKIYKSTDAKSNVKKIFVETENVAKYFDLCLKKIIYYYGVKGQLKIKKFKNFARYRYIKKIKKFFEDEKKIIGNNADVYITIINCLLKLSKLIYNDEKEKVELSLMNDEILKNTNNFFNLPPKSVLLEDIYNFIVFSKKANDIKPDAFQKYISDKLLN